VPEGDLTTPDGPDGESARAIRPRASSATIARASLPALRDPVIVILLLAGFFDGLSGNPIHSILLFTVALALTRDIALHQLSGGTGPIVYKREGLETTARIRLLTPFYLVGALVFAVVVGGYGRYSWPATALVTIVAALGLAFAWRGPINGGDEPEKLEPVGALAWATVFVGLGLWELTALFLQPTWTTDSRIHPTISVLTDPALSTHPGRSLALFAWLGLGWFLVQR
jgi:hypothetical protein